MSSLNLRFIRQAVPRQRAITSSIQWLSRPYSSKRVKPLAPLRPDLQPHVRRKQLQDMQINMYPRVQNNGVVQTFNEFNVKFSAMQTGVIDDKQLVTIRGVCHCTRCCSPATSTQAESTRSIMYCCCPQKEGGCKGIFCVYENPIYFCAIESLLVLFSSVKGRIRNYRDVSSKLIFYDLVQDSVKLQAVFNWARVGGAEEGFHNSSVLTRIGDIVS